MSSIVSEVDLFYQNFKNLSKRYKREFITKLLDDKEFQEDLTDIAVINSRINEPSVKLEDYLNKRKSRTNDL